MQRIFLITLFLFTLVYARAQSFDFGLEAQQNNNMVQKWLLSADLSEFNRAFSLVDINQDTMNVYFNTFSMTNNFEAPVYFRYNFKKRVFVDFKLSNTIHNLNMEGVSNYTNAWFTSNYGTYDDFVLQAQADGFSNVDSSDYENYINAAKAEHQRDVRSREEFKVLSFTANVGLRLMPQRSIKPYITAGFTIKSKYLKYSYQHLDFDHPNVYDLYSINEGVNKFSQTTYYINTGIGLEFYRFRIGAYYQSGLPFQATNATTNDIVVDVNLFTPFERIHSWGFTMSANLFSAPIGKRVIYDGLSEDEMVLSNIQRKAYKSDFSIRLNRRGFNDISTYYTTPDNRLSVLSRDSILYNNGGTIVEAEKVEMLTFGDVKRIFWSGQLEFAYNRYFGQRFSAEISLGFSTLTTDIETTEFMATVLHDSTGSSYLYSSSEPRLRAGVYRNIFNCTNLTISASWKVIDRDLFSLNLMAGSGSTLMIHRSLSFIDLPEGVNELAIYKTIDENYYSLDDNSLYAYQGPMNVNLSGSPDEVFGLFNGQKLDSSWPTPEPQRFRFPTVRFGFEASIDRFMIGLNVERSRSYMDGFLLNKYAVVNFSIGYKLFRKPLSGK
jgi:hypothetical protein